MRKLHFSFYFMSYCKPKTNFNGVFFTFGYTFVFTYELFCFVCFSFSSGKKAKSFDFTEMFEQAKRGAQERIQVSRDDLTKESEVKQSDEKDDDSEDDDDDMIGMCFVIKGIQGSIAVQFLPRVYFSLILK